MLETSAIDLEEASFPLGADEPPKSPTKRRRSVIEETALATSDGNCAEFEIFLPETEVHFLDEEKEGDGVVIGDSCFSKERKKERKRKKRKGRKGRI